MDSIEVAEIATVCPLLTNSTPIRPNATVVTQVKEEEEPQTENVIQTILEEHGYTIIGHIGSGSFARVKKAHSQKESKIVAIKVVSKSRAPNDYLTKFLPREIEVVKGLDHVNIIKYYRCIETTRRIYIIMQHADNGSLLDMLRRQSQLSEIQARHIYKQLLSAIEYCHRKGVVHRDIKCENLLFDKDNQLKIIDFGFARKYSGADYISMVLSDTYCGSYAYTCPQILRGIPYDPRFADQWASGVVLFAMVFGRLPFDDSSLSKLIKQVHEKINFSTKDINPVSEECQRCIASILSPQGEYNLKELQLKPWMLDTFDSASRS